MQNYGVRCNLRGDKEGAFYYFTTVIEIPETAPTVRANALVNRGCYFGEHQNYMPAALDFSAALATPHLRDDIRARSVFNLANVYRLSDNHRLAIAKYTRVINMIYPPNVTLAAAYCHRGWCSAQLNDNQHALADLNRALRVRDVESQTVATVLLWKGICSDRVRDVRSAVRSFSQLKEMEAADPEMRARAKWGLGDVQAKLGWIEIARGLFMEARAEFLELNRQDLVDRVDRAMQKLSSRMRQLELFAS
jgi:Flp pilus assembly protein TadD